MSLEARPKGAADRGRSLKEWTDEELVAEYRHIKDDLANGEKQSAGAIEMEMRRRGLEPDREDVIPDASVGFEAEPSPTSRGTAPGADEDSSG